MEASKSVNYSHRGDIAFFFDPPWGGLDYMSSSLMTFSDFDYPLMEAIKFAFTKTKNLMLKLPKNLDLQ